MLLRLAVLELNGKQTDAALRYSLEAERYQNNLQFIMVGKGDEIRKIVSKYGKVTEVQIKEDNLKAF